MSEETQAGSGLSAVVRPRSIPLTDFLGPLKPCPFCGETKIGNDGEGLAYCTRCDAQAPTSWWQFRAV